MVPIRSQMNLILHLQTPNLPRVNARFKLPAVGFEATPKVHVRAGPSTQQLVSYKATLNCSVLAVSLFSCHYMSPSIKTRQVDSMNYIIVTELLNSVKFLNLPVML